MDLEEFRAFLVVVDTGSFLAAATNLNMSRATLRRRVESLEARAGVPLLERSARGVVVTPAGAVLAERGRLVLQEASALVASVREIGREPVGVLRVALPVGLPPHAVAPLTGLVRARYPRLSLQLRPCDDPAGVVDEDVDLLVYFGPVGPAGAWLTYPIVSTRERLIASADYLARRGAPTSLLQLGGHDLMSWVAPGEDGRLWPVVGGEAIEVEPVLVSADVHLIRSCVLAGLGIGLVPDGMIPDPHVPEGTVVAVLPGLVGRDRALHVAVPTALAGLPKLQAVLRDIQAFTASAVQPPG